MLVTNLLCLFAAGSLAQGSFGAPENSREILSLLRTANDATVSSGKSAAAFAPNNETSTQQLSEENLKLLNSWQAIKTAAEKSPGFYTPEGAQSIIDFINNELYPNTKSADKIYTDKRDTFVQGGFIEYINPKLILLRTAVDAAGSSVQVKTPAKTLTPMALGFLSVSQNYPNTQEIQQSGPDTPIYEGECQRSEGPNSPQMQKPGKGQKPPMLPKPMGGQFAGPGLPGGPQMGGGKGQY